MDNHVVHTAVRDMHAPFSIATQAETRANIWQPWSPHGCTWRAYFALAELLAHSEFADTMYTCIIDATPPAGRFSVEVQRAKAMVATPDGADNVAFASLLQQLYDTTPGPHAGTNIRVGSCFLTPS